MMPGVRLAKEANSHAVHSRGHARLGVLRCAIAPEAKISNFETQEVKKDRDGNTDLHRGRHGAAGGRRISVIEIAVTGEPKGIEEGTDRQGHRAWTAFAWAMGDRHGISFRADAITPVPAAGGAPNAARQGRWRVMGPILLAFALAVLAWVLVVGDLLRRHRPVWHWYLDRLPGDRVAGAVHLAQGRACSTTSPSPTRPPRAAARATWWSRVIRCGRSPRASPSRAPHRMGLTVVGAAARGPDPGDRTSKAADALVHAWQVHAVRVTSPERGLVLLTATAT